MGALLGLTCGLGVLLIVRSFGPPARRRTPRVSRRDKVAEMLLQAGIESVTPGGLVACCAAVGGFELIALPCFVAGVFSLSDALSTGAQEGYRRAALCVVCFRSEHQERGWS